ncbi:MAG: dTDP-4-dehydrorhamnose 3,5-epimerase family protein [Alphaproteobacteria bacterium]
MKIIDRPFPGAALLELEPLCDVRGSFMRIFDLKFFSYFGDDVLVDYTAESINPHRLTLRGLHFQKPPYEERKLVRCVKGEVFDVAVDLRKDSPTEGKHYHISLKENDAQALFLPKGVAHGFLTLTENSVVSYHLFDPYQASAASGIRYDDPDLAITWPGVPQLINERDQNWPRLKDLSDNERAQFQ